jgi:hypothetical protein
MRPREFMRYLLLQKKMYIKEEGGMASDNNTSVTGK